MNNLIKNLNALIDFHNFEEAEKILDALLKKDPRNTDLWLRYARMELIPPLSDHMRGMECLNKILAYDKNNADAILLLACIKHYMYDGMDENIMEKLSCIQTTDPEYVSMIGYVKSWYFYDRDKIMYERQLLKSIQAFSGHVYNYRELGRIYLKKDKALAKALLQKALSNVKLIYNDFSKDSTDVHEYFNELVKGVHLPMGGYDSIKDEISEISSNE